MKKKIRIFLFSLILFLNSNTFGNNLNSEIQPEPSSKQTNKLVKEKKSKNFIIVTANDYASFLGYKILEKGGTVADAAVTIQLALGLVEPQSSGLGGGTFITLFENKSKKILSFEGREKAPKEIKKNIFLKSNGEPKKFFEAAIGGASVGVPSTLKTLFTLHKKYGKLSWQEIITPVIQLSKEGFFPPNRLINALKKENFFFKIYPDSNYKKIIKEPNKKFFNKDYTRTLEEISKNYSEFYSGKIANNIIKTVKESKNPGSLSLNDLNNYTVKKKQSLCHRLKNGYFVCGPNLPSSGTICVLQTLILFENIFLEKLKKSTYKRDLNEILEILNFIYFQRDLTLGDTEYEKINVKLLLDENFLKKEFNLFKKSTIKQSVRNFDEIFNSTTHFSLIDKYKNVLSVTSSIESSFGSRLFVNGFFLNNQLTDFSFKSKDINGKNLPNRPQGGKKPLSSMAPLIVFDENNDFFLTIGSPGGKAIISYVSRVLIDILYFGLDAESSIQNPNFIRIKDKTFVEKPAQKKKLKKDSIVRNLTSGLAVIKKEKEHYIGIVDNRRDGTVRGN